MADVSDPVLREWAAEVKDDTPGSTSWLLFGYGEKKGKIVPRCKGTGEAEEYWGEFLSHLSDDEILFGLVRIVMGDSESRRPKFILVIWLGSNVGVMKRAPVGMQKGDVKKVLGAIHLELEIDTVGELELDAVKKQLKKSMGADYDMGSNSRSASGKEGNAGASMGAEVKYVTQQSSIKANAAAAYKGGETVKLQGGIDGRGAVAGGAVKTVAAAEAQYKVVKKSQARAGFEMDSEKAAVIAVGTVVDALERKLNDKGIVRVRFDQGWISEKTGVGVPCLELISETKPVGAATPAPALAPAPAPPPAATPAPAAAGGPDGSQCIFNHFFPDGGAPTEMARPGEGQEITPEWLSGVLNVEVVSLKATAAAEGQTGVTFLLTEIVYKDAACDRAKSYALKMHALSPAGRGFAQLAKFYDKELFFYESFADKVADCGFEIPKVHVMFKDTTPISTSFDQPGSGCFNMLMEDLNEKWSPFSTLPGR